MLTTVDALTLGICYLESSDSLTMEQIRTISLEKENRDLRGESDQEQPVEGFVSFTIQ